MPGPSPSRPSAPSVDRALRAYARLALARPWTLLALAAIVLALSAPFAVRLYTDLRTDLRELLPRDAPAAVALTSLERRVGGSGHLSVVVEAPDPARGMKFVDDLTAALQEKLVPGLATEVRSKNDEDRGFAEAHGALYLGLDDLVDLERGLREDVERGKVKALGQDLDDEAVAPDPRVDRVLAKVDRSRKDADHAYHGYFADPAGHTFVVLLAPAEGSTSLASNLRLYDAVAAEVAALAPERAGLRVGYSGEVREVIEAQEHLVHDLELSSVLVLVAVGAAIVLFYRRLRALPLLVVPLLVGTSLSFAIGRATIGYLNPNTAFLGSIILGNGINAGIILFARYLEERRAGAPVSVALAEASARTWRATFVASAAAAASYACLGVTGFRGFNQFAFLGGLGMLLVWTTTYAFLPPLLVVVERWRPLASDGAPRRATGSSLFRILSGWVGRHARTVTLLGATLLVLAGVATARFAKDPIEYDFANLGSRAGQEDGAAYWGKRVDAVMQTYMSPTVILTETPERAEAVARALETARAAEDGFLHGAIARAVTLADVVPQEQEKKIAVLRSIRELLTPAVLREVPEKDRKEVETLRASTELRPVTLEDLPSYVRRTVTEKDGSTGKLVLVYPALDVNAENGRRQLDFARAVRETAERVDPRAEVAGSMILGADIIESITHDGTFASGLSLLGVILLTIALFGGSRNAFAVVGSLLAGTLAMMGTLGAFGIKLNFVNFAVLPITFGIGIDYAANLYQRYREQGDAAEALATSGGAIALCSLTTILGYSALLVADNRAIFSFGLTAVIGEVACLSAALVLLPAVLLWRGRAAGKVPEKGGAPLSTPHGAATR